MFLYIYKSQKKASLEQRFFFVILSLVYSKAFISAKLNNSKYRLKSAGLVKNRYVGKYCNTMFIFLVLNFFC